MKLFLDFDNTIVNSMKAFCEVYNELFKDHSDFKEANWEKVDSYNFKNVCPLLHDNFNAIHDIFEHELFFEKLDFIDKNAQKVINALSTCFDIYICTYGTIKNIYLKHQWIEKNLPVIKKCIYLTDADKSVIDMSDGIFIDDREDFLYLSNAAYKFCFGKEYQWNVYWIGERLQNWNQVYQILMFRVWKL